jgi:hypothetical protein
MTFSITTLIITALSITTLSITALSITSLSIRADGCYTECLLCRVSMLLSVRNRVFYAECRGAVSPMSAKDSCTSAKFFGESDRDRLIDSYENTMF